jgi:RNA polymerase sigma-70 factor, ECF subfamily
MNSSSAKFFEEQSLITPGFVPTAPAAEIESEVLELYDQFRIPVLRYISSIGLHVHDAEEITQEVFLALLRHFRLGRSRSNVRGWIFRVAHNLALKRRQAERRRNHAIAANPLDLEVHSDPALNPEETASFMQRHSRLSAVMRALPEQDQCCLSLRAEGLRYREISKILGISLGSVSNSLARSLTRLARAEEV